jgi:hypothetical protein
MGWMGHTYADTLVFACLAGEGNDDRHGGGADDDDDGMAITLFSPSDWCIIGHK